MSEKAQKLLSQTKEEYQNRLNEGVEKGSAIVFNNIFFIKKYKYNSNELKILLDELEQNGYIEKWILGAFELIVD